MIFLSLYIIKINMFTITLKNKEYTIKEKHISKEFNVSDIKKYITSHKEIIKNPKSYVIIRNKNLLKNLNDFEEIYQKDEDSDETYNQLRYVSYFVTTEDRISCVPKETYELNQEFLINGNKYYGFLLKSYNCENCTNCYACYDCKACNNCFACAECNSCNDCDLCTECKQCRFCLESDVCDKCTNNIKCVLNINCSKCSGCNECDNCQICVNSCNLENCRYCRSCNRCENCQECTECHNCTDCSECKKCETCYKCKICINCKHLYDIFKVMNSKFERIDTD